MQYQKYPCSRWFYAVKIIQLKVFIIVIIITIIVNLFKVDNKRIQIIYIVKNIYFQQAS